MTSLPQTSIVVPLALACLPVHGCTQETAGAVELSWRLYDRETGEGKNCDEAGVPLVALHYEVGLVKKNIYFHCDNESGVSGFEIPTGTASLSVLPACEGEMEPMDKTTFVAPASTVREITAGDVVTLDTQLIQVTVGATCP